jgi:hypothetical protein
VADTAAAVAEGTDEAEAETERAVKIDRTVEGVVEETSIEADAETAARSWIRCD